MVLDDDGDEDDGDNEDAEGEADPYAGLMGGEIILNAGNYVNGDDGGIIQGGPDDFQGVAPEPWYGDPGQWAEIQGVLMQKGRIEDAPLPEKFDRKMFDSVLAGYESLIASAAGSGDQHRFKLIGQLAGQPRIFVEWVRSR